MDDRNQFKKLRFDNDKTWKPNITQRELADKLGLAFSTICKLEKEGCDTSSVSTIKAYRDYFLKEKQEDICYEYFMGEVETRKIKYHELGKLFPFDDNFYYNLQELVSLDENNHFVEFMLSALLHNPQELFTTLNTIFNTLYKINHIQQDKTLTSSEKTELVKMQEYIFNQSTIDFLENTIMPLLQIGFNEKNEQLANESLATQEMLNELAIEDTTVSITGSATETSVILIEPTD